MLNRNDWGYKKHSCYYQRAYFLCFSKVPLERGLAFKFKSSNDELNKRKAAVEKHGGKREKLFFPKLWKEQPKGGWVGSRNKKEKPINHKVTGFFDGGSGGYEPLHGTRGTVSVTKHVGK